MPNAGGIAAPYRITRPLSSECAAPPSWFGSRGPLGLGHAVNLSEAPLSQGLLLSK